MCESTDKVMIATGRAIKMLRVSRNMSIDQLVGEEEKDIHPPLIGTPPTLLTAFNVSQVEDGTKYLSFQLLAKILKKLDCSWEDFGKVIDMLIDWQ